MEFSLDFFDALRRMKAKRLTTAVGASAETLPTDAELRAGSSQIGPAGLALIKRSEGCARRRADGRFEAYPDPGTGAEPWTIGWGATGRGIVQGTVWTAAECDARLERDLVRFSREVARAVGDGPTSQNQFDALVSFHYNTGAIAKATLTKLHKLGRFEDAAREFGKWVHAGGKRLNGLVRRREAEAALYRSK